MQVENGVVTSYAYDSANQQVQSSSGGSVSNSTFDANGNLVAKNAGGALTSYTWDEENRLVGVQEASGARSTYLYSQDGERRLAQTPEGNTRFVWDGVNLLQERDGATGVRLRHYSDFPGTWGGLTSVAQGVGTAGLFNVSRFNEGRFNDNSPPLVSHFFGADVQGNIRLLTDAAGGQSDSYSLSAFGKLLLSSGPTFNPFIFGGEFGYFTDELARLFVRARYYDPITGRWFSFDPIGFEGGDWNLFRYVANNPILGIDPSGLVTRGEVIYNWYYETDKPSRTFGPDNQVTNDVRSISVIDSCRRAWLAAGCPPVFPRSPSEKRECFYHHDKSQLLNDLPYLIRVFDGIRGVAVMPQGPTGQMNPRIQRQLLIQQLDVARIQLLLGSFGVKIFKSGKADARFQVENATGWESFYRNILTGKPTRPNQPRMFRRRGRLRSITGHGGTYTQKYTWIEKNLCPCPRPRPKPGPRTSDDE